MQNKPNFRNDKMNITLDMTSIYDILSRSPGQKTKPIQTQFKANKAKNKPNLSQYKPNTNPIYTMYGRGQICEKTPEFEDNLDWLSE